MQGSRPHRFGKFVNFGRVQEISVTPTRVFSELPGKSRLCEATEVPDRLEVRGYLVNGIAAPRKDKLLGEICRTDVIVCRLTQISKKSWAELCLGERPPGERKGRGIFPSDDRRENATGFRLRNHAGAVGLSHRTAPATPTGMLVENYGRGSVLSFRPSDRVPELGRGVGHIDMIDA